MNLFVALPLDKSYCVLTEQDSKHAIQVLRYQSGEAIHAVDGSGTYYEGVIEDPHPKRCLIRINKIKTNFGQRPYYVHLAVAPTKQIDRFEWFLEKATEIGIDVISPVFSKNSERKVIKPERLKRVITAAMKQSLKAYQPILNDACPFDHFIKNNTEEQKFIAHCYEGTKPLLANSYLPGKATVILIGPEGDFTQTEVEDSHKNGFQAVSLGNSRLRTETAAVTATHTVSLINQLQEF
ncbi:MAG: 16S rRNA (uracil(1498)-N(3))-methyltransferase [Bacteroidetes bacterium]|jgi:16S rRNA (uracil1498-N3)-methyltransferase|nr:16S rRNA (uracil(1498)-N(3))-methyltransferase [Bacteroidota bacterium]MBT6046667.1 16S rRNA (uracil(1498)-N(3))-methyltransferase [Candidatus Scalindua sp.]MBT4400807.1 16S rRNA (uracil(1498)-N(3))-methyltransferase [Bacteroidota bacterium]MBT4410985.1 16S rRNA (uracil(1498)-N(3))-methyltransferase [Bacteroidota bacterium]MBT5425169.1 16S rRNA (uracil(1498)-N(3))-methyltransferase [Bacteroidota bacterium]